MAQRYRVYAYSPSLHQKQQQMDLINDTGLANEGYAQDRARAFADQLNRNMFLRTIDWQPSTEVYEHQENPNPFHLPGRPG